jgi:nucleotidyltransferase substrate binding protein (TIGR01987 family)
MKKEIKISTDNYSKAVQKLVEGVEQVKDELDRDGVIQRFEFTFELFWKTLKLIIEFEGFNCQSPRSCIKEAFRHNIIVNDEIYLDMLESRNLSTHVYDEQTSTQLFERIKKQYAEILAEADGKFQKYVYDN